MPTTTYRLYDGARELTLALPRSTTRQLQLAVSGLPTVTLERVARAGQDAVEGCNLAPAMRAVRAVLEERARDELEDRVTGAAVRARLARRWTALGPVLTNYGRT
jgi:hypothetical protein